MFQSVVNTIYLLPKEQTIENLKEAVENALEEKAWLRAEELLHKISIELKKKEKADEVRRWQVACFNKLIDAYHVQPRDYLKARRLIENTLSLCEEIQSKILKDQCDRIILLHKLAINFFKVKNLDKAKEILLSANKRLAELKAITKHVNHPPSIIMYLITGYYLLGEIYYAEDNLRSAEKNCSAALNILKTIKNLGTNLYRNLHSRCSGLFNKIVAQKALKSPTAQVCDKESPLWSLAQAAAEAEQAEKEQNETAKMEPASKRCKLGS